MFKELKKNKNITSILTIIYFVNLVLYSLSSIFNYNLIETFFWFSRIPILILLYLLTGKNNVFYLFGLLLYQTASILFATSKQELFIYGSFASLGFKICLFILLISLINKSNRKAIFLSCLPFFILYLYIIELVMLSLGNSLIIWILNALITSIMGGIAIIHYNKNFDLKGYWLLISSIFFIIQIGAFFINKFYIKSEAIYQMVIFFYGLSHFTFYKFLILKEEETDKKIT